MLTTAQNSHNDKNWYPDSGSTNHVTNDFHNLSCGTDYNGNQKIQMGNGKSILIKHNGKSLCASPNLSHSLILNKVLHVPLITKNLLSVSQFCLDNHVFFEFYPSSCFVKDQVTKNIFLRGTLHKGLYRLDYSMTAKGRPLLKHSSLKLLLIKTIFLSTFGTKGLVTFHLRL